MIKFTAVPVTLDAAAGEDAPRTITGIAVPWDTVATVSGGEKVMFKRGAFDLNAKSARLLENHDGRPIGIVSELVDLDNGLGFSATFARSKAADDVVELIQMSAYDSVSVGAIPKKFKYDKNGVMIVSSAILSELSVVAVPAFADAIIDSIAASEPDPEEVEEESTEPQPDTSLQEETMSQETQVEASALDAIPTSPIFAAARREIKLPTPSEYITKMLQGGAEFAEFNTRLRAAAPDVFTSDIPGLLPEPIIQPVYNSLIGRRNVIDAIGARQAPRAGKVFIRPEVTTHSSIAQVTENNNNIQSGTFVVTDNQVTKLQFGGYVEVSQFSIDTSSPEILGILLDDMTRVYAKQTETYVEAQIEAGITTTQAAFDVTKPEEWADFVYDCSATILNASSHLPTHMFVSPSFWSALGKLTDDSGRPLFYADRALNPMNAYGQLSPGTLFGTAFGLSVVVTPYNSDFLAVGNADGFEIYEDLRGALSVDVPNQLSRTVAFYGYLATLMIDPAKFVKIA
jgi:HK97 family phage prohead protease